MRWLLLSAVFGMLLLTGGGPRGAGPSEQVDLDGLRSEAAARVGVPHAGDVPADTFLLTGNVISDGGITDSIDAGTYDVGAACAGVGQLSVDWRVTSGDSTEIGVLAVPCGAAGVFTTSLTVPNAGELRIVVRGDETAAGRAAYAILVTPPRDGAAQALLGPADDSSISSGSGGTGATVSFEGHYGAGSYLLRVACVGVGTLRVSIDGIDAGIFPEPRDLTCTPQGAVVDLEASTSDALTLTIGDASWTTGFASFAYRLSRSVES
jgi:hypothetical protein